VIAMANAFEMPRFLLNTNIYEVNIRQYTPEGTFAAFATHLPRLHHMGVEVIWLMPVQPIGIKNRKGTLGSYYSVKDYKAVNEEYGSLEDFATLVEQVHALGMKIIIDWVANHTAWDNVWVNERPHFFMKDDHGNFKNAFDWEDVIQINHKSIEQQVSMINAMQYWVTNFNIDGFRADLAHLTPLTFWIEARTRLSKIKKDLIWLAETEDIEYHKAFDISYTWKWMHTAELFCRNEATLSDCLNDLKWYKYDFPTQAQRMFFTSNHDENSWNGTEYEKYGNFVKTMAVFSCTYVGIPLIYSGQELPNKKRLPFFDKDTIDWNPINELHTFYKTLFDLRKTNDLYKTATSQNVRFLEELIPKNILAYQIEDNGNGVLVFLNFTNEQIEEHINLSHVNGSYKNLFTGKEEQINGQLSLSIEPCGYLVLEML
jgi:alpha-amylase